MKKGGIQLQTSDEQCTAVHYYYKLSFSGSKPLFKVAQLDFLGGIPPTFEL